MHTEELHSMQKVNPVFSKALKVLSKSSIFSRLTKTKLNGKQCFKTKFIADFQQCCSNKLESNPPHPWPRRPLYTILKRKTYKKEIQKAHTATGSQAATDNKNLSTEESPQISINFKFQLTSLAFL
uniref:Uncharacterized protein n=1 Tax=Strigops habroptila TaxID=2489341 RepID=A0A672V7M7_STRHB